MSGWEAFLVVAIIAASFLISIPEWGPSTRALRAAVAEQFLLLNHHNLENPRCSYDGKSAVVVHEFLDEPRMHGRRSAHLLIVHRIFRNSFGEYFLFISGEPPYVSHLTRDRAMNALRQNKRAFKREFGDEPG